MRTKPCFSDWENVLPEPKELITCTTVIARYTLCTPIPSDSDHSSDMTINEQECSTREVDLTKFLPEWYVRRQLTNKRRGSDLVAKKIKLAESKNNEVLPEAMEGDGNVVFEFDINNDLVVIVED
ncbi:hypothetical protein L1987_85306 [Smallanthus sonchifolius]|uniref:Uncharacterized protein n=1 Tax=Smallanthus sonchifolius TaxID=185202 RepID=A0ACB8XVI1_9ASTR|nr:hypothetical protein L1987_85306 [Smallanthus sonchifolius]